MSEKKAFKDWFDMDAAKMMASQMVAVHNDFNSKRFIARATYEIHSLEFNDRVMQFAEALNDALPKSVPQSLKIITSSLPEPLPDCEAVTDGWLQWPVGQYIASYCVDHPTAAWPAMVALTQRFSSEFAVRPFLENDPEWVLGELKKLTSHKSPHVRRWCSEGCRPCLPWGKKLPEILHAPEQIIEILEDLKDDPELYVRKSVANNLNDFSRENPQFVLHTCRRWMRGADDNRRWLINHALRSLIKQGNPDALSLLGYGAPRNLVSKLKLTPKKLLMGESLCFSLNLSNQSHKKCNLLIDFAVAYVKKNGKTSNKIFKWTTLNLKKGETRTLSKNMAFKSNSIRTLYPGKHEVSIMINGHILSTASFVLSDK